MKYILKPYSKWLWIQRTCIVGLTVLLTCFAAWATGISIPENSILDLNGGSLYLDLDNNSGNIHNAGTMISSSATIAINGNWTVSSTGKFLDTAGQLSFISNNQAVSQVMTVGPSDQYYDLIHVGDATLKLAAHTLDLNGSFINSGGTFDTNSVDIYVAQDWRITSPQSYPVITGSNTVYFDGFDQTISGETTFYDFVKVSTYPGVNTFTFPSGDEQIVTHNLELLGYDDSHLMNIRSSNDGVHAFLTLMAVGGQHQALQYLDVKDNSAVNGEMLVSRLSADHSDLVWNTENWIFEGILFKWDGSESADWADPDNWDRGGEIPQADDRVIIRIVDEDNGNAPIPNQPLLTRDCAVGILEMRPGTSLTLNQFDLSIDTTFTHEGTVYFDGNETITIGTSGGGVINDSGIMYYLGMSNGEVNVNIDENVILNGAYLKTFNAIVINEENKLSQRDTFNFTDDFTVTTGFTFTQGAIASAVGTTMTIGDYAVVDGGRFTLGGDMTVTGGVTLTAGNLDIATHAVNLTPGKKFEIGGGIFTSEFGVIDAVDVYITGGIFFAPGSAGAFTVSGGFTHTAGVFNANDGNVFLDGSYQVLEGSTSFYDLTKRFLGSGANVLVLENGEVQTVEHSLILAGIDGIDQLILESSQIGQLAELVLISGASQSLSHLNVRDIDARNGNTLVARGLSTDVDNNFNWYFSDATMKWDGSVSTDWDDPFNWDIGLVPMPDDTVIIRAIDEDNGNVAIINQPVLSSSVSVGYLILRDFGTTLYLLGNDVTIDHSTSVGTLANEGIIYLYGNEIVDIEQVDVDSGTFYYTGNGDTTEDALIITDGPRPSTFYNLTMKKQAGKAEAFAINSSITVNGAFVYDGPGIDMGAYGAAIGGDLYLISGGFTAPSSGLGFIVGGNFTLGAVAQFNHNSGTMTFNGTDTLVASNQTITGDLIFYNFVKEVPALPTQEHRLTFDNTDLKIVENQLILQGQNALNPLLLRSTSSDSDNDTRAWDITLSIGGTQTIYYVDVEDSDASSGVTLVGRSSDDHSNAAYNNTNWIFGVPVVTWLGGVSTDWDDPTNWDLGLVPIAGDYVVVPVRGNQPELSSNISIGRLTLELGSTLTLGGNDLTISDELFNNGNIILQGDESVAIRVPDTDSGTFTYVGGNLGTVNLRKFDLAHPYITYYNLVIQDSGLPDRYVTQDDVTVYGFLNITDVEFDISAGQDALLVSGATTVDTTATLIANNGDINLDGNLTINGTLSAPRIGQTFTVSGDWSFDAGATFVHNDGAVILDGAIAATVWGSSTFYDFNIMDVNGKTVYFEAGSSQTVENDLAISGGSVNDIVLRSTIDGSQWNIVMPNATEREVVSDVDVRDSFANIGGGSYYILDINGVDRLDNGVSTNTNWAFTNLYLLTPAENSIVGQTPVLIGQAMPSTNVQIQNGNGDVVATTTTDSNGNFRVVLGQNDAPSVGPVTLVILPLDANTLVPVCDSVAGLQNSIMVVATPTAAQVPTITSPSDGADINEGYTIIEGMGWPGEMIQVVANDSGGDLLMTMSPEDYAGTGTVNPDGTFSVTLTTSLPRGINYVSVVVGGVSSLIFTYVLNDVYGVIFDAQTSQPLKGAVVTIYKPDGTIAQPGVDLDSSDVNPYVTTADGIYNYLTNMGTYYIDISALAYKYPTTLTNAELPNDRTVATGSRGEQFTLVSNTVHMDQPMDATPFLFRIEKVANKANAKIGEVVTYAITIENLSANNFVISTRLHDLIPPGFKLMDGRAQLDGVSIVPLAKTRPVIFDTGAFNPSQVKTLRYQLVVGSGVAPGSYENTAFMKYDTEREISNRATESVQVVIDPLFDAGTVFGKVFYDWNDNGRQDSPNYIYEERREIIEGPVPNVRIVMEDGTIVMADKNGQFHIPGLIPGRHLLRLDERTLPQGTYLTTDKVQVIDVTPGSIVKANFGVNTDNAQVVSDDVRFFAEKVMIDQIQEKPQPRLNVDMFNLEILFYDYTVQEPVEFRIFMNYAPFVQTWHLDIIDQDTKRLVKRFEGNQYNIFDPIFWDGHDAQGRNVQEQRKYAYLLKVETPDQTWAETKEKPLPFKILTEEEFEARGKEKTLEEFSEEKKLEAEKHRKWILAEEKLNNTKAQTIYFAGETIRIDLLQTNIQQVRILKDGEVYVDLPVKSRQTLTARTLLEGQDVDADLIEVIVPNGDYEIEIISREGVGLAQANMPAENYDTPVSAGMLSPVIAEEDILKLSRYRRQIKVGEDYMMFVAMGDGKIGYNFNRGNIEPVQSRPEYQEGFYKQGKLAYYLKGKIKGKYLVTSSFDTERQQKEIFRTIKEEEYYPIYGDSSQVNYDATNTQGDLYLLVEWDKSSAIWGNYAVDFNDTEFAKYTRSLYGGQIDYTSVASTSYGEPKTKIAMFFAQMRQKAAHNEFLGTGGSLYYLKHRDVVPGSLKLKLEMRDAVTGIVRSTKQVVVGADYNFDEEQGRILFWMPVEMAADSGRLISNNLLGGDPVYVVTDYEYYVQDKIAESTRGARLQQALGDNVVVGTTYVSESQANSDYELAGQDVTVHVGSNATVKAEFAQSTSEESSSYISTDGGITFAQLSTGDSAEGMAYSITQDARLFDRLGLKSYYRWIENDFSSAATLAQQGKEGTGLAMTFDLTPVTRLSASYDVQKLIEGGTLQTQMQVGAKETRTTFIQLVHDARRLRIKAEFQRQEVTGKSTTYDSESNQAQDTFAIAAEYDIDEKTKLKVSQKVDASGKQDSAAQFETAIERQVTDKLQVSLAESFGSEGHATKIGAKANVMPRLTLNAEQSIGDAGAATTVGASAKVTDRLTLTTEQMMGDSGSGTKVGAEAALGKNLTLKTGYALIQEEGQEKESLSVTGQGQLTENTGLTYTVTEETGEAQKAVVALVTGMDINDTKIKAGVSVENENMERARQGLTLDATTAGSDGQETKTTWKVDDSIAEGQKTTVTFSDKGLIEGVGEMVAERSTGYTDESQDQQETYKISRHKDGKVLEAAYTRKFAEDQQEASDTNIFGLSGDIGDKWAGNLQLEEGNVQNVDGTKTERMAIAAGVGYVEKDEDGKEVLTSSTKAEARFDRGEEDKNQYLLYQSLEGKVNDETTLSGKFEYSRTKNQETGEVEAEYKEIMLGLAYRPIAFDNVNLFARYTYKQDKGPVGQESALTSDIEETKMQVLSVEAAVEVTENWQIIERLAYRIMEEKVQGFAFTKTHTWLLVNRANYRLTEDWKLGAEYRILKQKEAKDQKTGFMIEAVRSINDNVELGIGYNFTDFVDNLTDLDYTVQGPFVRLTGKLYDRTPEERARARQKWLEKRVEKYAWRMIDKELKNPDSPVVAELNQMYHMAGVAADLARYEESRQIYKDVILAINMMYEEVAQYIRSNIAFEEKLYHSYEDAQQYYDKGELWKARKLWEKIVEEAEVYVVE